MSFECKTLNQAKVIYKEFQDQDWPKTEKFEADVGKELLLSYFGLNVCCIFALKKKA